MNQPIKLTTTRVSPARNSVSHSLSLITSHYSLLTILLFALASAPKAFGVSPAPDGGYSGNNTAEGTSALFSLTSGIANTALGFQALYHNTTSNYNTAEGFYALFSNTSGAQNTATGSSALVSNTTGSYNTANGVNTLSGNSSGSNNTASGLRALIGNSTGSENTAVGVSALPDNGTGGRNTAVGVRTLFFSHGASNNIALGYEAGKYVGTNYPVDNNIEIGNGGQFYDSNTIRIGDEAVQTATYIAGISGTAVVGDTVVVDANGQLGTATSSARFKKEIKPMDKASEAILALKPVSFQYKSDTKGTRQFGLIAEEVARVNPDLVVRDRKGEIYSVRYEAVNAMLLNEFLKEHMTVQELKSIAAKQETTIAKQQKQIKALTTGLEKVSAQLELSKSASQMAGND